jgi:dsRNA-specific ribonuclease
MYEFLYEILKDLEIKYSFKSTYVLDVEYRNKNYQGLKEILSKRGFKIDDSFKDLYIISLLDRKYATAKEASMFAELEQLGDAIYELAVDNILFYDKQMRFNLNHQSREELVKADAQLIVSKKIGLDKLYISKFTNMINTKYDQSEFMEQSVTGGFSHHYLADSLEMVIGSIGKEFGIQKALDFATDIILEANPDLEKPEIFKNFDYIKINAMKSNFEEDYLEKIYPPLFCKDLYELEYYEDYNTLSFAIIKILKIVILGNDTIEKRKDIANTLNYLSNDDKLEYQCVASYLYYGIEETIEKFRTIVESSYRK